MHNKTIFSTILLIGIILSPAVAVPQPILIKGGTVITITDGIIENGDVLLKDGKIEKVGENIRPPDNAQVAAPQRVCSLHERLIDYT